MIRIEKISTDFYPDFIYRYEDFLKLFGKNQCLVDHVDALILYTMVVARKPKNVLEIGRYHGASTVILYGALVDNGNGKLTSVDIDYRLENHIEKLLAEVNLVTIDSKDMLLHNTVSAIDYDMFFIDGDHTYEGVTSDINSCHQLSNTNTIYILHDIDFIEVYSAAQDFCKKHSGYHLAILSKKSGIIFKTNLAP